MKSKLPKALTISALFLMQSFIIGQAPNLGVTSSFALFTAIGAFNNIGASTSVAGDVGTNGGAFNAFPPGTLIGQRHVVDVISAQAANDVLTAYMFLSGITCGSVIGTTLGSGQILLPNVYCLGAASTLNGDLILDGGGDPNALFVFKIDGALSTNTLSNIILINGASVCNVFWQINGAISLGVSSVMIGTILAQGTIGLLQSASLHGRALSTAGAISMQENIVNLTMAPVSAIITESGPSTFCVGDSVVLSGNIDGIWSNGETTQYIIVKTNGDYFVTNTNSCGSVSSNHILVTVNPLPISSMISAGGSTSICVGDQVILSGNSGGTWSTGETTSTILVTTAGDYFVTNTNSCGSVSSNHILVTVNPLPISSMISAGGSTSICVGDQVILSGNSGGTWSTGETTSTILVTTAGDYFVTNTNSCGSVSSNHILVTVNPLPISSMISAGGSTSICAGDQVMLSGNSGGTWNTGETTSTILLTTAGDYFVTNTNGCGSVSSNHILVTVNPLPVSSMISAGGSTSICAGDQVMLSGNSGGTWSTGETTSTIMVTTAGDYFVTNTNSCGSVSSNHILITVNPLPISSIISASGPIIFCEGDNVTLSGNVGGVWSNGATTSSITLYVSGDFFVTNTTLCNSVISNHIIVTANPLPTATTGSNASICNGNGIAIGSNSIAGHTYLWTPATGLSSASISNPIANPSLTTSYTLTETITATGCKKSNSVTISLNASPGCLVTGNATICSGQSTQLCALSGTGYSYNWSNFGTAQCILVNSAGTYKVTVTKAGCSSICSKNVILNPTPSCNISGSSAICLGSSNTLCAPSGFSNYLWSNGATSNCITINSAGTYSVTVTNLYGCKSVCNKIVDATLPCTGSISGDVWFDINRNGIYDLQEKGINGLRVYIIDAMSGLLVARVTTRAKSATASYDGYYVINNLAPGMYYVKFEKLDPLVASKAYSGNNPNKDSDITNENGANTTKKFTIISGSVVSFIGAGFQVKTGLTNTGNAYNISDGKIISFQNKFEDVLNAFIYPNPVNDQLNVELWIPQDSKVEAIVFDLNGKAVLFVPFGDYKTKGRYHEILETINLAEGPYILQIKTNSGLLIRKFTVFR